MAVDDSTRHNDGCGVDCNRGWVLVDFTTARLDRTWQSRLGHAGFLASDRKGINMTRRTLFGRIVAVVAAIAGYKSARQAVIEMDQVGFRSLLRNGETGLTQFACEAARLGLSIMPSGFGYMTINEHRRRMNLPDIG